MKRTSSSCLAGILLMAACGPPPAPGSSPAATAIPTATPEAAPKTVDNPLYDPIAVARLKGAPDLRRRVVASAHAYFRFTNLAFSRQVCQRFEKAMPIIPTVNLHGDAHLEQYSITNIGHGLTDFDDSSQGPAVVDLVRFGVSLQLACKRKNWTESRCTGWDAFIAGYKKALDDPKYVPPAPAVVPRIRAKFSGDRAAALRHAESLMKPIGKVRPVHRVGPKAYVDQMLARHPELKREFFAIKKEGRLTAGVGSALSEKYLFRIEGPSSSADDDLILEAKSVRDLTSVSCIRGLKAGDAMRILTGQARIAKQPYRLVGYVIRHPLKGDDEQRSYWVHAWEDEYVELSVDQISSPEELAAVAHEVGAQLGTGHPNQIADPHGEALRRDLLELVRRLDKDLRREIKELTRLNVAAWRRLATDAD